MKFKDIRINQSFIHKGQPYTKLTRSMALDISGETKGVMVSSTEVTPINPEYIYIKPSVFDLVDEKYKYVFKDQGELVLLEHKPEVVNGQLKYKQSDAIILHLSFMYQQDKLTEGEIGVRK